MPGFHQLGIGISLGVGRKIASVGLLAAEEAAIVAIINSITGETDATYIDAVNSLCEMLGGIGEHEQPIDGINEIGNISCEGWSTISSELTALNALAICLGGEGGNLTQLAAWQEIEELGFAYNPETDEDLNLYYSSRSGNTLLETGSGSSRNAQIMPRVGVFNGTTNWLNFGADYNPSPEYLTIYAAFKRTGGSTGNGAVFATSITGSPYTGITLYVDKSSGKIGTYTNAFKFTSGTPATVGEWVRCLLKIKMGNSGKAEIAYNDGEWETLHDGFNFPSALITGNGVMSVGAWQGTGGTGQNFFPGEIAEVKIWESSKEWANIYDDCDMWIPIAGNGSYEYAMNSSTKLAAAWQSASFRFNYSQYGSRYWMDKGYEIWKKDNYSIPQTHWVPKGADQTALLAGSWEQIKVYDGSLTGFNFFDSYIDFDPTGSEHADLDIWDRDNETILSDYARVNYTLAGYIHQYYTDHPYYWHSDEINRNSIKNYFNDGYKNRLFPKATDNSMGFNSRKILIEILSMDEADAIKTAFVETYTGDKLLKAGVCFTHDDYGYVDRLDNITELISKFKQRFFHRFTWFMDVPAQSNLETDEVAIQAIIDSGVEIGNHTKNHPSWTTYLLTHTDQEFYDNEISPVGVYQNNVFGITLTSFAYPRNMGFDQGVDDIMLNNNYSAIRHTDYNGTDPVINTMHFAHYVIGSHDYAVPAWMTNNEVYADLETELAYAKANNTIFTLCLHAVEANSEGTNISYEWYEKLITYCLDNNMQMYLISELPEL